MKNTKNSFPYYLKITGVLLVITMSIAFILSFVNAVTKDVIAANEEKKTNEAVALLFPQAENAISGEAAVFAEEIANLEGFYKVNDGDKTVGFYAKVAPIGFKGAVTMLVGLDLDGKVCGVEILSHSETVGIGDKALNKDYTDRFNGIKVNGTEPDVSVDAIGGATYSSKAVKEGVRIALVAYVRSNFTDQND